MVNDYYTQLESIRQRISYDPDTGNFTWKEIPNPENCWKISAWNKKCAGMIAGSTHGVGYKTIGLGKSRYLAHRLAWLYTKGEIPEGYIIDHINGVREDNRISNLRCVTKSDNSHNTRSTWKNAHGSPGVNFHKQSNKWNSRINHKRKQISLGYYNTKEEAAQAYAEAKAKVMRGLDPK